MATEGDLFVPDEVREYGATRAAAKHAERAASDVRLEAWRSANADSAARWDVARTRSMPSDLIAKLVDGLDGTKNATRKHSATVLERLAECVPYMAGGSADLAGSAAPPIVKSAGIVGPRCG